MRPYGRKRMRFFRRSILWIVPAVVIPLGALLIIQYRFLRTLESKTVSAERSWLRDSAEVVADDIDQYYRTAAWQALTFENSCLCRSDLLSAHFAQHPLRGARSFFVVRFDGEHAHYDYFFPQGSPNKNVGEDEEQAVRLATVAWHVAHEMKRLTVHPPLLVDERDQANRVILRPAVDDKHRVIGVVGVILDD